MKLSALGQGIDASLALENARTICTEAKRAHVWVTIDAEDHTSTDSTLSIVRTLRQGYFMRRLAERPANLMFFARSLASRSQQKPRRSPADGARYGRRGQPRGIVSGHSRSGAALRRPVVNTVRKLGLCAIITIASSLSAMGVASAEPVAIAFQINPAPLGNPNGSFDVPAIRCAAVVGEQPGTARVTGDGPDQWGCTPYSPVQWINLSTGATGSTQLSVGLNGHPSESTLNTGPGQVALVLTPQYGTIITPGLATFYVP